MATSTVRLRDVTLHYGGDIVVRDVNLDVGQGETKIILGPSGVGKTTILRAILGLLSPETGQVYIDDQEITHLPEKELVKVRLRMAMVFQGGALFDSMTVGENTSFRLREHGLAAPEEIEARVEEALSFVGLSGAVKLKPAQLSGGMKKRAAIARALAARPEIILFDEPTTGLDPVNSHNIESLIRRMKQSRKVSIVIVTHDVGSALRLGDSIAMLHEGKFIFEGTPKELKESQEPVVRAFREPENTIP